MSSQFFNKVRFLGAFALATFVFPFSANAEDLSTNGVEVFGPFQPVAVQMFDEDASEEFSFETAEGISNDMLSDTRGMALDPEVLGISIFDADVVGNKINGNVNSGSNIITGNAFSGSKGFNSVAINSGPGSVVQQATIVNVVFQ